MTVGAELLKFQFSYIYRAVGIQKMHPSISFEELLQSRMNRAFLKYTAKLPEFDCQEFNGSCDYIYGQPGD